MTSCSEEDIFNGQAGDVVTFNVSIPELATRAASEYEQKTGDGFYATSLYYGVYEKNDNSYELKSEISAIVPSEAIKGEGGKFNFQVRLVKQKPYRIVFWAENKDNNMCAIDWGKQTLNLNPSLSANQEAYDAFWVYKDVTIQGATEETVELKRPFAQLNIGVSNDDWEAAVAAGIKIENSQVVISNVPTTMNIINGTVDAEEEVTYTAAPLPKTYNNDEFAFPVDDNKYLTLNYVLVGETKSLINIGLNYMDEGASGSYSTSFTSVPVQRNYRTNIYGNILTSDADYNVEIKPGFYGEVNSEDMLKYALTNGGKFTLLSDMTWPKGFSIPEGKNVEIDLNDNTLTIDTENKVKGNLSINNGNVVVDIEEDGDLLPAFTAYNGAQVDLDNANINLAGKNALVVVANSEVAATINVNKTTITGASGSVTHGISMPFGAKDIKINITESTLTSDYALYLYATNSVVTIDDKSLVKDFWIMGGKVDIAYTDTKPKVKMDGLAAEVNFYSQNEYPLHAAIAKGGEITLTEDVVLTQPIALAAGVEATLNLNGNILSGNFSKDGDNALINNSGKLTLTNGTFKNTAASGAAVINNSGELTLGDDVTIEGAPFGESGHPAYAVVSSGTLNIEEGASISAERGCLKLSADGTTVINGGTFTNQDLGSKNLTSHVVDVEDGGSNQLTINGGTFQHLHAATSGSVVVCNRTKGTVYVNGGSFSGGNYYGNNNLSDYGYGGTFVVKGGTYSAKPAAKYIPEGYQVVENGGKFEVKRIIVNASSASDVAAAIANGSAVVLQGYITYNTTNTTINKDAEINLNGNTFEAGGTITLGNNADLTMIGGNYEVNGTYGHVDVRPSTAEGSVLVYERVDFSFNKLDKTYGPSTNRLGTVVEVCATATDANTKIRFENCTFDNAQVLFEGMSGKTGTFEAEFVNCTFNALTSSAPIYVQNYVKGTITLTGCTFNLKCTSSTASAVSVNSSSSTSVTINAENNIINAYAATPYTYDASKGETEVHNVKVNGTPANIKFISCYGNTTVSETGTTKTGIAQ